MESDTLWRSFRSRMQRRCFDVNTAYRLGIECAKGLQFMHNLGYMHRDIKSLKYADLCARQDWDERRVSTSRRDVEDVLSVCVCV